MSGARGRRADMLRLVADRLGLPELGRVVEQPGINEAYRLTVRYHDGRHPDQVATLTHAQDGTVWLEVVYRRTHHQPAFEYLLDADRYRSFDVAMRRLAFDRLDDQPGIPYLGVDLWLIERAAGSYRHDVVLAPALADGVYGWLVDMVKERLPQAIRAIQPD